MSVRQFSEFGLLNSSFMLVLTRGCIKKSKCSRIS